MFVRLTNDTTYSTGNEGQKFRTVFSENALYLTTYILCALDYVIVSMRYHAHAFNRTPRVFTLVLFITIIFTNLPTLHPHLFYEMIFVLVPLDLFSVQTALERPDTCMHNHKTQSDHAIHNDVFSEGHHESRRSAKVYYGS